MWLLSYFTSHDEVIYNEDLHNLINSYSLFTCSIYLATNITSIIIIIIIIIIILSQSPSVVAHDQTTIIR